MFGFRERIRQIPKGVGLLSVLSGVAVVLGLVREMLLAYYFGTSELLDAFLVAFTLPRLFVTQIVLITASVVLPEYVGYREEGRSHLATALVQRWFRALVFLSVGGGVVAAVAASPIISVLAPGLDPRMKSSAANWLRALLPYVVLMATGSTFKAVLESHDRFGPPALARVIVIIAVVAFLPLARVLGIPALILGYSAGAVAAYLVQWLPSRSVEPEVPSGSISEEGRKIDLPLTAAGMMVVNSVAVQAFTVIDRAFASLLPEGSIAALNYANAINAAVVSVFGTALGTVLFPRLAKMTAGGKWKESVGVARRWILVGWAAGAIPVAGLIYFRAPLISLLFERGAFDSEGVRMTAEVLSVLPMMILISATSVILMRLLLAQKQNRAIALIAIFSLGTKFLLNAALVPTMGLRGLALATVLTGAVAVGVRYMVAVRTAAVH